MATQTTTTTRALTGALALLSLLLVPIHAHAQVAQVADVAALRAQIAELDQKLRILDRKNELKEETAAADAKKTPVVTAGASGFILASPDKAYSLRIRGNIQADARQYIDTNGDTPDAFVLRRIRPSFEGALGEDFGFRIMPDFANNGIQLLDAYVTYKANPSLNILIGKSKSPFDLERLVSQTNLLFIERSYPTLIGPNRDTGIQFFGDFLDGRLSYQAAFLNGASDGGSVETDTNDGKDYVFRLFTHPFKNGDSILRGLGFGGAVSSGTREVGSGAIRAYTSNALVNFATYNANVRPDGDQVRFSPQIYYYNGPFGILGSFTASEQDLIDNTTRATATRRDTLTTKAWSVTTNYVLTGEDTGYNTNPKPKADFNLAAGTWGAWEIAARLSQLSLDDDAFTGPGTGSFANRNTQAQRIDSVSFGVNWYLNRNVKASLNFEHSEFKEATGRAAALPDFKDENAVLARVQLSF